MESMVETRTLREIRVAGIQALVQHLGVVGAIRFLQYEDKGYGDYSRDRHQWLGNPDLNQIADDVKKMKE